MRQSELSARLSRLAETLFRDAQRVLVVGLEAALARPSARFESTLAGRTVTRLAHPAEASAQADRFEAAVWCLTADTTPVRSGLAILRGALAPGAVVLVAAPERAPTLQQLRALLAGESSPRAHLAPICDALLLSGYLAPRVHQSVPGWLLVSAELARTVDALDAFFEQPARAHSR